MKTKLRIGITGLNNTDNPAPGYGVIKSLLKDRNLKNKIEIVGLSYSEIDSINFIPEVKEVYIMPYPSQGPDIFLKRIKNISLDAVIPNLDAELLLYIKYKKELNNMGIKLLLPTVKSFEYRNKSKLSEVAKKLKIKVPNTYIVNSINDVNKLVLERKINYPFYIKGLYYKAYKVSNPEDMIEKFFKIANEWGYPLLAQEIVKGKEINLVGVGKDGQFISSVSIKKLTTTDLGKVWTAISIKNNKLEKIAKKFVKIFKWSGPFELECIQSGENIYLIEINPRFPAWVNFATMLGINLPAMIIKDLFNIPYKRKKKYDCNKLFYRYVEEGITDFNNYLTLLTQKQLIKG